MSDRDLIQRLLDGDLNAEEEASLSSRVATDPALAAELAAHQAIARGAARLPRPVAPQGLEGAVLDKVARLPAPAARRHRFMLPRFDLEVSWAGAAAAGLAALVAVATAGIAGYRLGAAGEHARDSDSTRATRAASREVVVRFALGAPQARRVEIAGDFNGWRREANPLAEGAGGLWSTTLPVTPGRHEYLFVVDGKKWVPDPSAAELVDDGFGGKNAVIEVLEPI